MDEDRDLREAPASVWEYISEVKNTARVCQWIWQDLMSAYARTSSKKMMVLTLVAIVFQLTGPLAVQYILNGLVALNGQLLFLGFAGFIVGLIGAHMASYYHGRVREAVLTTSVGSVDQRITELFFEKSMGQHLQESSSLNLANIEKGRSRVMTIIDMLSFGGIEVVAMLFISFVLLWSISYVAGLIMTVAMGIYLCWSLYLNKKVTADFTPIERQWRHLNRRRVERWEKIERVKTCGKEADELAEMNELTICVVGLDLNFWLWFCRVNTIREAVARLGLVLVMMYGAWQVWEGKWLLGSLYPLFSWAGILAENMWQLGRIEHQLNWNVPSVRAMKEALMLKPAVVCLPGAPLICHKSPVRVAFDGVSYTYPKGSTEEGEADTKSAMNVIRNISFEIAPGEKVALIGPSGAGKTTIMRLLLRCIDPDTGSIHVNGYKLQDITLSSWMKAVGYIPQQPQVLDGTIRYNLTYGLSSEERAKITDGHLWELMRLLQIDFGKRLDKGLDTVVGRSGVKLSGGQAQRLMIGAAAMKRPLFMVIDEATSSLDSSTEKLVQQGLAEVLSGDVSALVIAHRLSSVRELCDKFIVLCDAAGLGDDEVQVEAVASSFEELYAVSPTFQKLADDQGIVISVAV